MVPLAARILADMGADVIKVEPPTGDSARAIGPMKSSGMGPFYMNVNRNKRSIALDLKSAAGKQALVTLIKGADVLLYNVRPQAMARLGFDYASCRAMREDLIYVGAYGFSQAGPYAARPAFDDLIQGIAAIPSLIAMAGDGTPRYVPMAFVDRMVGTAMANTVLGALLHRERTGEGQSIEVPMFETMVDAVLSDHAGGQMFDPPIGPAGYPRSLAPERHPYQTRDSYICVMVYTDRHWHSFFELVGSDLAATDPRFASLTTRTVHAREIHSILREFLLTRTTDEWLSAFESADIPATPLHTLESLVNDPHLNATGFFEWIDHPSEGRLRTMRPTSKWSATPLSVDRHAPLIGEHTREILAEHGYSSSEIEVMINSGAAAAPPTGNYSVSPADD
jgi:crotonobetainyl-CoA:carnitine CoA-transferase CaiB-like acyl-CoA transferase